MTSRRLFLRGTAAGVLAGPSRSFAQAQGRVYRIGYLSPRPSHAAVDEVFVGRMRELGYTLGRNLAMYEVRDFVDAGGFVSYGPELADSYRRAAGYVDGIFNGARPGDLPMEQPDKLELVISDMAAKALDLTIPQPLLLRADEVIR